MARRKLAVVEAKVYEAPTKRRMSGEELLAEVVAQAEYDVKFAQRDLDKFATRFAENPMYALEWSANVFAAAARHWVGKSVLHYVAMLKKQGDDYERKTDAQIVACIMQEFEREVMRKARWPEHSTSAQSNEASLCKNAAMADWLVRMKERLEYREIY